MRASLPKTEFDDDDVDDEDESRVDYSIQDSESDERVLSDTDSVEGEEGSSDGEDDINVNWEFGGVGFPDVDSSVSPDPLRNPAKTYSRTRMDLMCKYHLL